MTTARQIVDGLRANGVPYSEIATKTGQSKATVVLWYTGKYPAKADRVEARIVAAYDTVRCPYLQDDLPRHKCAEYHGRSFPTGSPKALDHWRVCQVCQHNPNAEANQK